MTKAAGRRFTSPSSTTTWDVTLEDPGRRSRLCRGHALKELAIEPWDARRPPRDASSGSADAAPQDEERQFDPSGVSRPTLVSPVGFVGGASQRETVGPTSPN